MSTAHDGEAERALLFGLDCLCCSGAGGTRCTGRLRLLLLDSAELFGVGKDEVHVLVKGKHLTRHLAAVHQRDAHPVVDVAGHLSLLVRHGCRGLAPESSLPFKNWVGVFVGEVLT